MTKADTKRNEIAGKLADFILSEGLPGASLRPLAAAAGMSDRMLLYYFKDKEDIIATSLDLVARRLAARLAASSRSTRRPADVLEADLLALTAGAELWPYMCVWLEMASLAARGDPLFRAIGRQIAEGFQTWVAGMLAVDDEPARGEAAWRLLRSIEGAIVLRGVGVEPSPQIDEAAVGGNRA